MNKKILIILISCFSINIFAYQSIEGSKELPLELNLLVSSLGNISPSEQIIPIIMNIDSYARLMSKEDIFLIGKIEIYKTLLKSGARFPMAKIDQAAIKKLQASEKKVSDPFLKWFLLGLIKDCQEILTNPKYKEYLISKNLGRVEQLEFKKIDKKIQLLYRWVVKMTPDSSDFQESLKTELRPILIDSLLNIEASFLLIASNLLNGAPPPLITSKDELKKFSISTKEEKDKNKTLSADIKTDKTVEEILAPITAPYDLKNLPKPSDDADWLQDI